MFHASKLLKGLLVRIEGLVSVVVPWAFANQLADNDWDLSLENNAGLRALEGEQRRQKWEQVRESSQRGFRLLRRALFWSLLLLSSAVAAAWATSLVARSLSTSAQSALIFGFMSLVMFVWATLGRMGWRGQTFKGETIAEKTDQFVFRVLYWLGTYFGAIVAFGPSVGSSPEPSGAATAGVNASAGFMSAIGHSQWFAFLVGYLLSVLGGHVVARFTVVPLYLSVGDRGHSASTSILGMIERALLTTAVLVNQIHFIGLWITLKLAGNWKHLAEESNRHKFNCFLIGNGLSLLYAYAGARLTRWLRLPGDAKSNSLLIAVVGLLGLSVMMASWAWWSYLRGSQRISRTP